MHRSSIYDSLMTKDFSINRPIVRARFNLNSIAEYVIVTDANRVGTKPPAKDYGRTVFAETLNLIKPFRHAHGICYPSIVPRTTEDDSIQPFTLQNLQDSYKDRIVPIIPSSDNDYRYYISSVNSTRASNAMGYIADRPLSDIKISYVYPELGGDDPYIQLRSKKLARARGNLYDDVSIVDAGIPTKPMFLYGNAVHVKFNTVYSKPTDFVVKLGWRPYDSTSTDIVETVVYDSKTDGVPHISTGDVFTAMSIQNSGGYCQIELNATATFAPGEYIVISNVDHQVNGTYKVLAVMSKFVVIEAPFAYAAVFDNKGEIYALDPGEFTIYRPEGWDGVSTWSMQETYWKPGSSELVGVSYVKLIVNAVNKKKAPVEIIEIMPSLYADFTDVLQNVNIRMEGASPDPSQPVGLISSNSASVELSNIDGMFSSSNYRRKEYGEWTGSPLAGMLVDNVEFWIDNEFIVSNSPIETFRMGTFVAESWSSNDTTASVDLADYAKIMMEREAPDVLLRSSKWIKDRTDPEKVSDYKSTFKNVEGYTVTAVVQNIMGASGWSKVARWPDSGDELSEPRMRYFWSRREESLWSALQEVAESTQTAIFFDRFGMLKVLPRFMFADYTRGVEGINAIRVSATQSGDNMASIIKLDKNTGDPLSKVMVRYNNYTSVKEGFNNNAVFWTPPENMQLRLAELVGGVKKGADRIKIKPRSNGVPFEPSGTIVFSNVSVDYEASSFFRTFGQPRGAKSSSVWEKWWVGSEDALEELKERNDGYDVVAGNELYLRNGLSGMEQTDSISHPISDPEDYSDVDGWKVRYVIDGANNQGGDIDGQQWRTFSRNNECWVLNCRRSEFPRGIKLPSSNVIQPNDQYLICFKDFEDDDVETLDRIITKFQFIESDAGAAAGITLYNRMAGARDRFYAVKVKLGDKFPGKKRNEPIVKMHRIDDDGTPFNLDATFQKEAGTSIEDREWCILELEVIKANKGKDDEYNYEFNVYLNGWKIGTFEDKTDKSIKPNTKAGFFVTNGVVEWDGFVTVEEGGDSPVKPAKNAKQRKKLKSQMKKTKRKKKKGSKQNKKSSQKHTRGRKSAKPKGKNKTRNSRKGNGRRG